MIKIIGLALVAIIVGVGAALFQLGSAPAEAQAVAPAPAAAQQEAGVAQAQPLQADAGGKKQYPQRPEMQIDPEKVYVAKMQTTLGPIELELYPDKAPEHVNSFVFLAREGFYDGVIFHRVIPGFMIQGGDPTGTGTGGPGYSVPAEFNDTRHVRGVLSAARSQNPNSAGSQFFIVHQDSPHLDRQYTAFGKVTSGIETVDEIVSLPTGLSDRPQNPPAIESITIEEKAAEGDGAAE